MAKIAIGSFLNLLLLGRESLSLLSNMLHPLYRLVQTNIGIVTYDLTLVNAICVPYMGIYFLCYNRLRSCIQLWLAFAILNIETGPEEMHISYAGRYVPCPLK